MRGYPRSKTIKGSLTLPQRSDNDHQHSTRQERRKQEQIAISPSQPSRSQECRCPKHLNYVPANILHSHTNPLPGQEIPLCNTICCGPIFLALLLLQCLAITQTNAFVQNFAQKRHENILDTLSYLGQTLNKDQHGIGLRFSEMNDGVRKFRLHFLRNASIKCNDGTRPGYYIRRSKKKCSKHWLVFLQGGWYCFDGNTCKKRQTTQSHLFSSEYWKKSINSGAGILSWEKHVNPVYHHYHIVYVPYCSSDLWTGTNSQSNTGYFFHGSLILKQVFKDLMRDELFRGARNVLLAGSSAGGIGVLMNIDRVARILRRGMKQQVRVRGLVDSAWFLHIKPYTNYTQCNNIFDCDPIVALKKGMKLWKPKIPKSCIRKLKDGNKKWSAPIDRWNCFLGPYIYSTIKSPLYIIQSLFDDTQLRAARLPILEGGDSERFTKIRNVGLQVQNSLREVRGVFAHSCVDHEILIKNNWSLLRVNGITLGSALKRWDTYIRRNANKQERKAGIRQSQHRIKGCGKRKRRHRRRQYRLRYERQRQRHMGRRYIRPDKSHQLIDTCRPAYMPKGCTNFQPILLPQCNPTCSPLSHPESARRMTLVDLLQLYSINIPRVVGKFRIPYKRIVSMSTGQQMRLLYCGRQLPRRSQRDLARSRPHR